MTSIVESIDIVIDLIDVVVVFVEVLLGSFSAVDDYVEDVKEMRRDIEEHIYFDL